VGTRRSAAVLTLVCALAVAGCGAGPTTDDVDSALDDDAVTVASFNFPESELLARIYGQALRSAGYEVRFELGLGPREFVQPALAGGLVEFVPEYAGTAVAFLSLGDSTPTDDIAATGAALDRALRDRNLVALAPAAAQDSNAVVVTRSTAERYTLDEISDLETVAPRLTFGGPPECPQRPFCLAGPQSTYRLDFADFFPLDVGGPLTHQALAGGHVDVAQLFTTDPRIDDERLVMLADDRRLQPADNVIPVVRTEVIDRWGQEFVRTVDAVSSRLTTGTLRGLNGRVVAGEGTADVAASWLRAEGLA
jgi:osmoprotectant transport system substrate-binding protein